MIYINAAAAGKVTKVGYDAKNTVTTGYGWRVVIDHGDGWETVYGHLQAGSTVVSVGDRVEAGDTLGVMGGTGYSRPPGFIHLHFEARHNGVPVNPELHYVAFEPVPPPPVGPPDVTPPPEWQPPVSSIEAALSAKWRLISDTLRIRTSPTTATDLNIVGLMTRGAEFDGVAIIINDGGLWIVAADDVYGKTYRAALHSGVQYLEIVK
jgi:hypothetical protein